MAAASSPEPRWRRPALVLLPLTLVPLWVAFGHTVATRDILWKDVEAVPASFLGRLAAIPFGAVTEVTTGGFRVRDRGSVVPVVGVLEGVRPGQIVSVEGRVGEGPVLLLEVGKVHHARRFKWASGVVTLLVVGALLVRRGWAGA
jgi:hypothetical protein